MNKKSKFKIKDIKKRYIILACLLILTILTIIQNAQIRKTEFIVKSDKLPEDFEGFTIAQISDLHNAEFGENNSQIITILKKDQPDMIVITGDIIDSSHTDFDVALELIENIKSIAPIYFVSGNHEAWIGDEYQNFENELINKDVHILKNQKVTIKKDKGLINLIGLEDPDFYRRDDYVSSIIIDHLSNLIEEDKFNLLLSHRPELFEAYVKNKVDIVLSGHAHGGQFRLPFIGGLIAPNQGFFPKYDAGMYEKENTQMIVSKGIGNSIIPIRFNNQPELVYIKLGLN